MAFRTCVLSYPAIFVAHLSPFRFETSRPLSIYQYCPSVLDQRSQVVAMAVNYTAVFGFNQKTLHDALQIFDEAVCHSSIVKPETLWPLVLLCAMLLAARTGADRSGSYPTFDQVRNVLQYFHMCMF